MVHQYSNYEPVIDWKKLYQEDQDAHKLAIERTIAVMERVKSDMTNLTTKLMTLEEKILHLTAVIDARIH